MGRDGRHAHAPSPGAQLLDAGRADERLVREAFEGAREPEPRRRSPTTCTPRCARASRAPGIDALYAHQAQALRGRLGRADDRHHRHRLGQVAVLQPADARRAVHRRRARARSTSTRPRRWPRTRRARCNAFGLHKQVRPAIYDGDTRREERRAIRQAREPRAHQPRHAARRDPAQPRRAGATSSPTSPSSSSTRRTSTAACSARTSPTCCAGCAASPRAYGTQPRFLLASATIANPVELAERLTGLDDVALVDRDGSPGARRADRDVEPAGDRRGAADAAQRAGRGGRPGRRARARAARGRSASSSRARRSSSSRGSSRRELAGADDPELADRVAPYRAGYTPQQRRELEARLTSAASCSR